MTTFVEQFDKKVREIFVKELNSFLLTYELPAIKSFTDNAYDLNSSLSLAIYSYSPEDACRQEGDYYFSQWMVEFYYNESDDKKSVLKNEKYRWALTEFIARHSGKFSEYDVLKGSHSYRMDQGAEWNGSAYLIESRIQSVSDYYYSL